jgi:hypothetical protein
VVHFITGEKLARVSQANTGLLSRDMRLAPRARVSLTEIPIADLIAMMKKAADLYLNGALPIGDGSQTPDDRGCPSVCVRPTCRRITSCCRIWRGFWTL